MKRVLVPLADGFEEIETVTVVDVLRRAGVDVVTAGLHEGALEGSRKIRLIPDTHLGALKAEDFSAVVLVGGQPGVDNLRADPRVLELVRRMDKEEKLIGAICAAPLILRDAGIAKGLHLTSHPGVAKDMSGSHYEESRVVYDRHRITSRSPGTAMEFALALVEKLTSPEKAKELARGLLTAF